MGQFCSVFSSFKVYGCFYTALDEAYRFNYICDTKFIFHFITSISFPLSSKTQNKKGARHI